MMGIALTNNTATSATMDAAYPFGVHSYRMFEKMTAANTQNCAVFQATCRIAATLHPRKDFRNALR